MRLKTASIRDCSPRLPHLSSNPLDDAWVQSHLVAFGQLATIERQQVFEHDIPAPAQQGAAEKQHHFSGFPFPEDTRRLQAHVYHPADGAFHASGARRQIQMFESGVLHPVAVFEKVAFKLAQRLDSLFRPFDVLVDLLAQGIDIAVPQKVFPMIGDGFSLCR
jgi:hypothetical protein